LIIVFYFYSKNKSKPKIQLKEIPEHWHNILVDNVLFYKKLSENDQLYFREQIQKFLNEVIVEPVEFELEELDNLLVAASAVIPVFGFENWSYPNIKTVIIYPDYFNDRLEFHPKAKNKNIGGMVGSGPFDNQMILSRKALHHGFSNKTDKGNTGIHEFVHLLDKLDGEIDGIPKALMREHLDMSFLQWPQNIFLNVQCF